MAADPRRLPWLGAGIGWRHELRGFLRDERESLGFVELMPEHVLDAPPEAQADILRDAKAFPVVTHSVSMSIGSAEGPDASFLEGMRRVSDDVAAPWASDHLCFTRAAGRSLGQLVPLPCTDEALDVVVRNVRTAQRALGRPLALENVTRYFTYPDEDFDEPEFFSRLAQETGCFVLLDVANVWNNARNVGMDAEKYLRGFPLDRVVHLHVAGVHDDGEGGVLDTHAAPVSDEVWRMTERVLDEAPVRALVIERDDDFGDLAQLAGEVRHAAALMEARRP